MLSIHDLLEDSTYKEFFCKVPQLPPHLLVDPERKPWRLFVRMRGEHIWKSRDYRTYKEAFVHLRRLLPKIADGAIHCKTNSFSPPYKVVRIKGKYFTDKNGNQTQVTKMVYWRPKMIDEFEDHTWCPYCRRPTVFAYFDRHHALSMKRTGGVPINPMVLRCTICGASENIVKIKGGF